MPNELEVTKNKMDTALEKTLNNASSIITKDYLARLETYKIMSPSTEDIDIDIAECGKFFKLSKLVMNKEENFLNKLTTIVNVTSSIDCSIATIIKSDGQKIDYYFGIISKNARGLRELNVKRRRADALAFEGALKGNLIGSELNELSKADVETFRKAVLSGDNNCYSSVSGIVALRDKQDRSIDGYVQGIENLVDSLKGQKYTIVMLADPVSASEIEVIKQGYELLHTELSSFAGSSITLNESDTMSLSKARTNGISKGISEGISMTQSRTKTRGKSLGMSSGVSLGIGGIMPIQAGVNVGFSSGTNRSISDTMGRTNTTMNTSQRSRSVTDTVSSSKAEGRSLQLTFSNRSAKALLDKIDRHLERLDECESFGAFDCAAYVIAENRETALTVASNYNALMRGKDSGIQASHINSWFKPDDTRILGKYIGSLVHPRFLQNESAGIVVTPASIISGDELAIQIGLPKKSVSGITVVPMAPFGRNVIESSADAIALGKLYHMGNNEGNSGGEQEVKIDIESLSMHTFITGSTGKGKSTAIYSILDKLMTHKVKGRSENIRFMVVEPAKGEYKDRFGGYDNVHVYGTNYKKTTLLRMNPFSFPEDIHVLEHIDRLIEIFNVCWPMYAAMPAVLKDAVERAYIVCGWNLETSECRYADCDGKPLYPSFVDVSDQINIVLDTSSYSTDSKGDYKGALCTRLKSLTNGLYSRIFTSDELTSEQLFDENVIVDLSRVGAVETKALIMGLLVIKLQEYRMAAASSGNEPIKHVTVLEEAHNILKRTSTEQTSEGSNILGKSVEMLADSIAEMRTYGEGFIIADQAPGLMDLSVIRNTNTKIILGLPDLSDRELVGRAANLNDDQITELSRLKTFVAAVYQNNWLEPVLCNIDTDFAERKKYSYNYDKDKKTDAEKMKYIDFLLMPLKQRSRLDKEYIDDIINEVYHLPIKTETKLLFTKYVKSTNFREIRVLRQQIVYSIFNADVALGLAKDKINSTEIWYDYIRNVLEPDISGLSEDNQYKVIALITKEQAERDKTDASIKVFEHVMNLRDIIRKN